MLDQREEVIVIGLLKAAADGEGEIDRIRSKICEDPDFEPYSAFKALQSRPMTSGLLTARDVTMWLKRQYYKTCLMRESEIQAIFEHYGESGMLRYESFLKMILPREDRRVRSMVMCRRTSGSGMQGEKELGRDGGYHFIRLLEQEAALNDELTLRKKRLLEYEWRESKEHLNQRSFSWLQSESAVPGVVHVSVLGVCRLLCDVKEVLTVTQVERLFHRVNLSGSDMLSYAEFCEFFKSNEAAAYLNELYIKYYSTMCPGCGSMCQRDGGACNNVTCPMCRTTFRCETNVGDSEGTVMSPRTCYTNFNDSRTNVNFNDSVSSPRTPKKTQSLMNRSGLSTTASMSPRGMSPRGMMSPRDLSFSSIRSPSTNIGNNASFNTSFNDSFMEPKFLKTNASISVYQRQKKSLYMVTDTMLKMLDIDAAVDMEKEHLWQNGLNAEACFDFMDRYGKGYVADTDMWQTLHSEVPVSFSQICQLFRDLKSPGGSQGKRAQGQLNLGEMTMFIFPRQSEEWQHVSAEMNDDETKNVLYVVRSTVTCPGCASRVQRTFEGCSSVTCPVCHTPFRCNLIGDDREQEFRLTLTQKHKMRQFVKFACDASNDLEVVRKELLCSCDSLSTVLLDAFLLMSEEKGYVSFLDFKRNLLAEKSLRLSDIEMLWYRFAGDKKRLGFVEFAQQIRPFGTS